MTTKTKPALVLPNKLVLVTGTHNGINYSEQEVQKLYNVYKEIETKLREQLSIDEVHAFDIHCGDDEDHKDSTGTWVGDAEGVYWDETNKGFGFKKLNIVDSAFAEKIEYQKAKGKTSFGVSPRLNVLRVGSDARDIKPKNISIVLTPAGGEPLMLSRTEPIEGSDREYRQDLVQELTLSEQGSLGNEGGISEMEGTEILKAIEGLNTRIENMEKKKEDEKMNAEMASCKKLNEELEAKNKTLKEELAKKKDEEEKMQKPKDKDEEEKMQKDKKKDEEEKMQKGKKDEEDKMQKDKTKYKYYGALQSKDSLLKSFSLTPDLKQLDATSINRVAEDIVQAAKTFGEQFTLEQAQAGVQELQAILVNLPSSESEQKKLMEKVETTLSSSGLLNKIAGKLGEKVKSGSGQLRKGLVPADGSERSDETLSEKGKTLRSDGDIRAEITSLLTKGLGVSD